MELIHAKDAYSTTLASKREACRKLIESAATHFNSEVYKASLNGKNVALLRWKDFDVEEQFAYNDEATEEFLEGITGAGYVVEFCYNSPSAYNPCGIIAAWGANIEDAESSLADAFDIFSAHEEVYRGE